jgi:thiamine biosynthesis lipoprotein
MTSPTVPGLRRVEHVMGMPIVVDVRDEGGDTAVEELFAWLCRVDAMFSTYRNHSEISRLDRGELVLGDADPDVREVLERCERLRIETDGYFDARAAPDGPLDPSGLVKGWAVERGASILEAAGLRNFAVNAGGDIRLAGGALPDDHWRVGIEHPERRERVAAVLAIRDGAVATSAGYARGEHVFDPRVRPRRTRLRPAHRPTADRRSLRHDHGTRPRHRRRVRDSRVRHGLRRAAVDGAVGRLRGDDDPRGRPRPLDARLPSRR